jgi:hypothetical protein
VLQEGESLAAVAGRYYEKTREWRAVAEANNIDDPIRLRIGTELLVPPRSEVLS